ncbi:hypothetical protein TeGR_g9082 [Tetraparma gracilis]|uniref:Tyrosine specific protein phosphatases domain-containing protein n=1 Tax=Tetraparma gracilis TaxID=2962635 RepID=A0ABQ6N5X9_9STRA|nr:hypothetical protein TeGR_g9082 [Tetraparma gracilis]
MQHNIEQLRLPTLDTCAPKEADLRKGAEWIRQRKKEHPGKRVYVHCKGGIGRASTMTLSHLVLNGGRDVEEAVDDIKRLRPVVMREVIEYQCLVNIAQQQKQKTK